MSDIIQNRLDRLGLPINYKGNGYIATHTAWRDGNTPTGLWAYENNCWDVTAQKNYSWPEFVATVKHISIADAQKWLEGVDVADGEHEQRQARITLPQTLDERDFADMTKSYSFFLNRGISAEVLDTFGAGLMQGGPFYGRITFPIRMNGVLRGATGRDALNRPNVPKWKHKGHKSEFIYPLFEPDIFKRTGQVCLVESVGDALSLYNAGIKQVLVQFGLNLSPKLLSFVLSQNPQSIFVSLNNDEESEVNRGQVAALRAKEKLSVFFNPAKIIIAPPFKNDFGDQRKEENLEWAAKYNIKIT